MGILELVVTLKLVDFLLFFSKNKIRQIERLIHRPILIFLKMAGLEQLHPPTG